jgi:AcrR family transcriptional regulator
VAAVDSAVPSPAGEDTRDVADESTRDVIARVAQRMFAEEGYAGTSLRSIARTVGVDPALVVRYFGSKEALFLDTLEVQDQFAGAISGPIEGMGARLVGYLIDPQSRDQRLRTISAMTMAADREDVRKRLQFMIVAGIVEPLMRRMTGRNRLLRAHLVAAQINGILNQLAIVQDDELLSANVDLLAQTAGRALQVLIEP